MSKLFMVGDSFAAAPKVGDSYSCLLYNLTLPTTPYV